MKFGKFIVLFLFIMSVSCVSEFDSLSTERYVVEYDTTYKKNSFEIDFITRTFYKDKKRDTWIYLRKKVGKDSLHFLTADPSGEKIKMTFIQFNGEDEFFNFLSLVDTLYTKLNKDLQFDVNYLYTLSTSESGVWLQGSRSSNYGSYLFSKSDTDSLRSVYEKYKLE